MTELLLFLCGLAYLACVLLAVRLCMGRKPRKGTVTILLTVDPGVHGQYTHYRSR